MNYLETCYERVQEGSPPHMLQSCREEVGRLCTRFAKALVLDEITLNTVGTSIWSGVRIAYHVQGVNLSGVPTYPNLRQLAAWRVSRPGAVEVRSILDVAGWVLHHIYLPPHTVTDFLPATSPVHRNTPNP